MVGSVIRRCLTRNRTRLAAGRGEMKSGSKWVLGLFLDIFDVYIVVGLITAIFQIFYRTRLVPMPSDAG